MEETSESAPPPRRSKREHHPTAKAAAAAAASSSSAGGASADRVTRRSQRHAKPSAPDDDSSTADPVDSRRSSQRRRVTPSSSRSASRASSPVRVMVSAAAAASASPLPSSQVLDTGSDSGGDDTPMLASPALPSHQRRRYRAASSASTGAATTGSSSASGRPEDAAEGKVLGRYSSHECALLCEVVLSQLRKRALAAHVLEDALSPGEQSIMLVDAIRSAIAHIVVRFTIAKRLESLHRLKMSPAECQQLWKFLAYGQSPSSSGKHEELLEASDEEDIDQKPEEINARLAEARGEGAKESNEEDTEMAAPEQTEEARTGAMAADSKTVSQRSEEPPPEKEDPPTRLYPQYTLPTGEPEDWQQPFGPKDTLPMTFVAAKFLK
ncbi:hypothetical protein BBJ28_00025744, partial [Nothophytophthora sp. Chile5]